jgi:hypothetical protein
MKVADEISTGLGPEALCATFTVLERKRALRLAWQWEALVCFMGTGEAPVARTAPSRFAAVTDVASNADFCVEVTSYSCIQPQIFFRPRIILVRIKENDSQYGLTCNYIE